MITAADTDYSKKMVRLDSGKLREALSDASPLSQRERAQWRLAALPGFRSRHAP